MLTPEDKKKIGHYICQLHAKASSFYNDTEPTRHHPCGSTEMIRATGIYIQADSLKNYLHNHQNLKTLWLDIRQGWLSFVEFYNGYQGPAWQAHKGSADTLVMEIQHWFRDNLGVDLTDLKEAA